MYNKLFAKIVDSSIWLEPDQTRIVWFMFIALMNEDGFVGFASIANVAYRARISHRKAAEALKILESPDANSADPDNDGRRIEKVPGGWIILNAEKYRNLVTREMVREQTRERVARHRAKSKSVTECNALVTPSNTGNGSVTLSDTDTDTDTSKEKKPRTMARPQATDEDWLKELEADQTYAGVNIRLEFGKAQNWCKVRGYVLSRKRFINWVNNCKPIQANGATPEPKMSAFEITKRLEAIEERLGKTVFDKEKHKDERDALFKRRKELKALLRT